MKTERRMPGILDLVKFGYPVPGDNERIMDWLVRSHANLGDTGRMIHPFFLSTASDEDGFIPVICGAMNPPFP